MTLIDREQEGEGNELMIKDYDEILEYDDDASTLLTLEFGEELELFYQKYSNDEVCRMALLAARGWRLLPNDLLACNCPRCGKGVRAKKRERAYIRKVKDRFSDAPCEVKRILFRCSMPQCRKEFNVATGSIFDGYDQKLWICYLCLYCMALLNGKVPITYLVKEYFKRMVDEQELMSSVYNAELKIKDFRNIRDQLKRIVKKISPVFEKENLKIKRECFKYVGFEKTYQANYLDWYTDLRSNAKSWKISWTPGPCTVENEVAKRIATSRNLKSVHDVQYIKKWEAGLNKTWVLCFEYLLRKQEVKNIRWLYVDRCDRVDFLPIEKKVVQGRDSQGNVIIETLDEETFEHRSRQRMIKLKFANYQIIQVVKNARFLQRPFRITNEFREAFSEAVLECHRSNLNNISPNNIFSCPDEILHKTAYYMSKNVEMNMDVTGSSL